MEKIGLAAGTRMTNCPNARTQPNSDDGPEKPKRLRTPICPKCNYKPSMCICDEPAPEYKATDDDLPANLWHDPEL